MNYSHVGPTNSGKTYAALQALRKAPNRGIYLAPLRLLAAEVKERFVREGYPCNLITGQEQELMDGAKLTSSTVEMLPSNEHYDVAVIDEIQMLGDIQRGNAWTRACMSLACLHVFL